MILILTNSIAVVLVSMAIALCFFNPALADTVKSNSSETLRQAAQEIVKDTGVKEQFGKSENGDRLLDQAQEKASHKLENLAQEADSKPELPASKKLFLKNLTNQS
ncbi:MAG: hypothetical protein AAGE96_24965 [Cyanobacteria bacterium P01_G01_bin.19]